MGLFDFLFSSGVSNSQKKAHRNAGNNTSSDHENYARGYEDGYDECCCVRIPVDTRSLIPVISVHSISNLQYRRQS